MVPKSAAKAADKQKPGHFVTDRRKAIDLGGAGFLLCQHGVCREPMHRP